MLDNCYTYNPPTHEIHKIGRSLDVHIQGQFTKHFPEISSRRSSVAPVTAPSNFMMAPLASEGRSKRNIKPPKVYEPEDIPMRKHRLDEFEDYSKKRRVSTATTEALKRLSEGPVGPELISTLATAVQSLQEQISMIQNPGSRPSRPSPSPTHATSSAKKSSSVSKPRRKGPKMCAQCSTTNSKVWRSGPLGRSTLCDTCGIRYAATKKNNNKKPLTYEEKMQVAERVGMLDARKQAIVVDIVKGGNPLANGETIVEVDVDKLDQKTLRKLFEFVMMQDDSGASQRTTAAESDSDSDSDSSDEVKTQCLLTKHLNK
jgi:hypothetical protein